MNNLGTIFRISFRHLDITNDGGNLVLSWPTNQVGFTLQSSDNLNSTSWIDCTNDVVASDNKFFVTNAVATGQRFFRLKK